MANDANSLHRANVPGHANELLEESLRVFGEKFNRVLVDQFTQLTPIGDALKQIRARGAGDPACFVRNLVDLSSAIIQVRNAVDFSTAVVIGKSSDATLGSFPVPPYDLWLPFKAEDLTPGPAEGLDEAVQIFESSVAAKWIKLETPSGGNADHELADLAAKISDRFSECNQHCVDAVQRQLFSPSDLRDSLDLFMHRLPQPVASGVEFEIFITAVFKVFYDGFNKKVEGWEKSRAFPEPLPKVAAILLSGESANFIRLLRNKMLHPTDAEAIRKVADITEKLIGRRVIAPDNRAAWLSLQKEVARRQLRVLEDVCDVFGSFAAQPEAQP
jgi:hypothetical protein